MNIVSEMLIAASLATSVGAGYKCGRSEWIRLRDQMI